MKLELTNDETNALAAILDIAVKAAGIRIAEASLVILKKMEAAARDEGKAEAGTGEAGEGVTKSDTK